jgi:small neutral amino acid transporter SnatA (MarC family)
MNEMKDAKDSDFPLGKILAAPAVLVTLLVLFFGADFLANGNIENDGYMNILILPIAAAFAAALGRIATVISLSNSFTSKHRAAIVPLGFLAASIISIYAGLHLR